MIVRKQLKPKKCKSCGRMFVPLKGLQKVCGLSCSVNYQLAEKIRKKKLEDAKALRVGRVNMRTVSDWKKLVQAEFNKFIRLRDDHLPCVSCGTVKPQYIGGKGGVWDCGHYMSRGSTPELRYVEDNCAKQCKKCNSFGSGRIQHYRVELIKRIGLERVEWLEGPHEFTNYTKDDLIKLLAEYKAKNKALILSKQT